MSKSLKQQVQITQRCELMLQLWQNWSELLIYERVFGYEVVRKGVRKENGCSVCVCVRRMESVKKSEKRKKERERKKERVALFHRLGAFPVQSFRDFDHKVSMLLSSILDHSGFQGQILQPAPFFLCLHYCFSLSASFFCILCPFPRVLPLLFLPLSVTLHAAYQQCHSVYLFLR